MEEKEKENTEQKKKNFKDASQTKEENKSENIDENKEQKKRGEEIIKNIFNDYKKLKEENEELKKKEELWKIKCADLINEKEINKEQNIKIIEHKKGEILERFLFFLDNFEQAVKVSQEKENHSKEDISSFLEGFKMNIEEFNKILTEQGVKKINIEPFVDKFDPEKHETIKVKKDNKYSNNVITKVLRVGYFFHQRVLRPAWVEVNIIETK